MFGAIKFYGIGLSGADGIHKFWSSIAMLKYSTIIG